MRRFMEGEMKEGDNLPLIDQRFISFGVSMIVASLLVAVWGVFNPTPSLLSDRTGVEEVHALRFEDGANGSVVVLREGEQIAIIESGEGAFVRGSLRALVRQRRLHGLGSEQPFHVVRWRGGRVTLEDPATGQAMVLNAFGPSQVLSFTRLVDGPIDLRSSEGMRLARNGEA